MEYTITKIALKELEAFTRSDLYVNSKIIPISKNRINSYLNNPRADDDDYVLYLAIFNSVIVGFRTILPDIIFKADKEYKFGWFSGSWVSVEHRREGISSALMDKVFKDWNEKLIFTNYAPNSKLLYDKSNKFDQFFIKNGVRLYFNFQLTDLLVPRSNLFKRIKPILQFADWFLNTLSLPYRILQKLKSNKLLKQVNISDDFKNTHSDFIKNHNKSSLRRGKNEYEWVFKYPWVTTISNDEYYYPFSSTSNTFYYKFITISNKNDELVGLAIVKNRDGQITIPYFEVQEVFEEKLTQSIIAFCHNNRAKLLTCYNEQFVKSLKSIQLIAIGRKSMCQKYFISKVFYKELQLSAEQIYLNDGDGDCIFT